MKKVLHSTYVDFVLEDNLLTATFKKGLRIDLETAKEIVATRLKFTDAKIIPVLILNEGVISMDKAARDYLASEDGTKGVKAAAIVLRSTFGSMLGNFFLKVNTPEMPVKIFYDTTKAIHWLNKFIS